MVIAPAGEGAKAHSCENAEVSERPQPLAILASASSE